MSSLKNKNILIGVTAGIAIYKVVDLCSKLIKKSANVRVVMTKNAAAMVAPLTFETISQNKVTIDLFNEERSFEMGHITNAKWGDVLLIAPATGNIIGKAAAGIADDALSTLLLAFDKKIFFAPAMNPAMWNSKPVQENIETLKRRGATIIEPGVGVVACGDKGSGRLPEPAELLQTLENYFASDKPLAGKKVLITAGPTREFFDPVRCISNPSSGKMGYAMAEAAAELGAETIIISGPTQIKAPENCETVKIDTAEQMLSEVISRIDNIDIAVFSAAVSDYRPSEKQNNKIKKGDDSITIELVKNPDIALEASKRKKKGMLFIGFAAESKDLIEYASEKMKKKSFDMIIANDISRKDAGFETETNETIVLYPDGTKENLTLASKKKISDLIWIRIQKILNK